MYNTKRNVFEKDFYAVVNKTILILCLFVISSFSLYNFLCILRHLEVLFLCMYICVHACMYGYICVCYHLSFCNSLCIILI